MCVVSNVTRDWMDPTWPKKYIPEEPFKPSPNAIPWPLIQSDPKLAEQMLEILKRLEAIDKRLGTLEQCKVTEPKKRALKKRLKAIAKKAKS